MCTHIYIYIYTHTHTHIIGALHRAAQQHGRRRVPGARQDQQGGADDQWHSHGGADRVQRGLRR